MGKLLHEDQRTLIFRSDRQAHPEIPFDVRSVGYYVQSGPGEESFLEKPFVQLFWLQEGTMKFSLKGREIRVNEGEVFCYFPGEPHHLRWEGLRVIHRFVTFDHEKIEDWLRPFGWLRGRGQVKQVGSCPEGDFTRLHEMLGDATGGRRLEAAALGGSLLSMASIVKSGEDGLPSPAERFRRAIDEGFRDAALNINQLADTFGIHRSHFFRIFRNAYGMSPSRYLHRVRLQNALAQLKTNAAPLEEISGQCGYADAHYLGKVIRRATGLSPGQFRREG